MATCNALAYAHSRGVLHRDLKPANIMLGKFGETLVVDWGLAKISGSTEVIGDDKATLTIGHESRGESTAMGQVLGTPAYMSPEQAAGRWNLVGPASDIYGLGATLYHLLTGQAPFQGADQYEVLENVQRGDFMPPRQMRRDLPRALDAVCRKAMALEPASRYATVKDLADDVEHWLADEPATAYREPWPARLARWARRHKPLVAGAAALVLTAVVMLTLGILVVNEERRRTDRANADLAVALDAEAKRRQQARDALDAMSSQVVEDWLAQQKAKDLTPQQEAFLQKTLQSYEELARDTGQEEATRAGVAAAHRRVGNIRSKLGQSADAEAAFRNGGELYAQLAADFPAVPGYRLGQARNQNNLAVLLYQTGRPQEAETAYRDALAIRKQLATDFSTVPEHLQDLAESHYNLGTLLRQTGRPKEAESAYHDALAIRKQLVADFPTARSYRRELGISHNSLGFLFRQTGRLKEAESAFREALAIRKHLADQFPTEPEFRQERAQGHNNLGILLRQTGRPQEAETAYRDALAIKKQLAADFPTVPEYRRELAGSYNNLGNLFTDSGRPQEAENAFRDALAIYRQLAADFPTVPDYQNVLASTLANFGDLLRSRQDFEGARKLYEAAVPHHQAALKANPRHHDYREFFRENRQGLTEAWLGLADHRAAAVAAREVMQAAVDPAKDFYNTARYLARCMPLAEKDAKLPEAKRKELARTYGDQAVAALQKSVQNGYKDVAHMKKDKDLDSLRSREDFKKLLAVLAATAPSDSIGRGSPDERR